MSGKMIFDVVFLGEAGELMRIQLPDGEEGTFLKRGFGSPGERGFLSFDGEHWRFRAYCEQTLQRAADLDTDRGLRLGWRCEAQPSGFTAPVWVIPGEGGRIIEAELEQVQVEVPREFADLAEEFGVQPADLLRQFVADAAGVVNYTNYPRADGLSSGGSDECEMAQEYMHRAWGGRLAVGRD